MEAVFKPGEQVELQGEARPLVLLAQEAALLVELPSGEYGRPDRPYSRGDAAQGYDQGEQRVHLGEALL